MIIGGNFDDDRGNITAYATYRKIDPVLQSSRDYSSCTLNNDVSGCRGSATIPEGRISDFGEKDLDGDGLVDDFDFKVSGNEFVDAAGATYNYGALNYYQRPDERITFGSFAHFDITSNIEVYSELMYMDDRSVSQIAPSGAFFITDHIECGNPFLSAQQFQQLCGQFGLTVDDSQFAYLGRRNVEGGPRQQDLRHTSFRGNLGFRGDINETWRYDFYGQFSEVSMENTYSNDLSITKIKRSLNAVRDPDSGEIVCQSVVDGSDPDCVPWNIFQTGAVTQDMIDYLVLPLFARGTTDQAIFSGYIAGKLGDYGIKSPAAESGIDLVIGYEHREENLEFNPDNGFRSGDGAGQGGATHPVKGGYSVEEFFFESSIPLIENRSFARELTLDLGYRSSEYSLGSKNDTFAIRTGWAINDSIKLRGSFQRAIRAANIRELYLPEGLNLFDMDSDPCSGAVIDGKTAAGRTFEQCARSGVTADQFGFVSENPAGQYNYLQGGQADLIPEKADTYSFGFIWSPEFVEDLNVSVDVYSIEITNGIKNLTQEGILNRCLDGNMEQCSLVKRSAGGDLWLGSDVETSGHIISLNDNLATEEVEGLDFVVDYALDIGALGRLRFNNVTAYIETWDKQEIEGAPIADCKGAWGQSCEDPTPDLRNSFRVTWDTPWNITTSVLWRYISEVEDLNESEVDLDEVHYLDLSGTWDVTDYATLRVGVNNVLDEAPPLAGNAAGSAIQGNGNIFPGVYDALGRYVFAGASLSF
jgi:iron complex outermembrane recepter protein